MEKQQVIMPMAGHAARFKSQFPHTIKPLIDVNGRSMIARAIESINLPDADYTFIILEEHARKYRLDKELRKLVPECSIVYLKDITRGAAETIEKAKSYVNLSLPVTVCNCDQIFTYNKNSFFSMIETQNLDGVILTFKGSGDRWSYASIDERGFIDKIAEKEEISDHPTVGMYWYKNASDLFWGIEEMILKDIRIRNEYYLAVSINQLLPYKKFKIFDADAFHGLGDPESLNIYLSSK